MADALTPAELTLLGLLLEKPRHGYELDEVIEARGMRQWTEIGFSSIYYLLNRLRERGLIAEAETPPGTTASPPGRGRARRVYRATDAGRRACARAAEDAVAELRPVFPPLLVGIANQPAMSAERLRAALERRDAALTSRIAAVTAARDAQGEAPGFVRALFDYALGQLTAEQRWLDRYRAQTTTGEQEDGQP